MTSLHDAYMPSLSALALKSNLLTKVSELPTLGKQLNKMSLTANCIQSIDMQTLSMYTNMTTFIIANNPGIITFLNVATLPNNGVTVKFQMSGNL